MDDVHLMGHSLGAHIMGQAGRAVPGIARVTGQSTFFTFNLLKNGLSLKVNTSMDSSLKVLS